VFANIISIPVILAKLSWFVSIPLSTLLINLMFSNVQCPLTKLENAVRFRLGYKPIYGFVGFYLISPIRKFIRKRRKCGFQTNGYIKSEIQSIETG